MKIKPISTVAYSNEEAIRNIMTLYDIERFDLDCTYSTGNFWKNLPEPVLKSDLIPRGKDVLQASSDNLPFESQSMGSIMFDPPFVIAGKTYKENNKGSSIIAKRFEGYENFEELKAHYFGTLKEAYRLLKEGGFLVLKTQDTVSSGKNHFTHALVMNMALEAGYYPRDMFVLVAKNRINSFNGTKWKKQHHARKYHSYFWVFEKRRNRVNYNF